jgi:hypothetical protein
MNNDTLKLPYLQPGFLLCLDIEMAAKSQHWPHETSSNIAISGVRYSDPRQERELELCGYLQLL